MFVIVEDRDLVIDGFVSLFKREGFSLLGVSHADFPDWLRQLQPRDRQAIEGIFVGDHPCRAELGLRLGALCDAPMIALLDGPALQDTLTMLGNGYADVLRKPVHVRELVARAHLLRRRGRQASAGNDGGTAPVTAMIVMPPDGGDPMVAGKPMNLPRRERRILEYLVLNRGRRVTKAQLFTAIYGLDAGSIEETVLESHISKLRKKLRKALGHDPISSQRFLGYCLDLSADTAKRPAQARAA